jgi:hypothetical protein
MSSCHQAIPPAAARALARAGVRPWAAGSQELLQAAPALGQVAALLPEPPQGRGRLQGPAGLAGLDRPGQGGPEVGVLQVAAVQPLALVGSGEVGAGGHGQVQEPAGVAAPGRRQLAGRLQLLPAELADRLQHREPALAGGGPGPGDQRLVD